MKLVHIDKHGVVTIYIGRTVVWLENDWLRINKTNRMYRIIEFYIERDTIWGATTVSFVVIGFGFLARHMNKNSKRMQQIAEMETDDAR